MKMQISQDLQSQDTEEYQDSTPARVREVHS